MLVHSPAEARAAKSGLDKTERRVLKLINRYRLRNGRPRVRPSRRLARAADRHSLDMVRHRFFAHASRDGTDADARIRRFTKARATGENIAFVGSGKRRPATRIVNMWIHSPSYRAVLLNSSYRRVGVARRHGRVGGQHGTAFTADFASRY